MPERTFIASQRSFTDTRGKLAGSQNSTPGWEGRHGDDHVLRRDGNDAQSAPSLQARREKEAARGGSQAISQKDERDSNKKAKEDHPEAPEPVIGMNSG